MADPHSVDVWMRWEFEKLNAGHVARPRSLESLLSDPTPLETKDGAPYEVDRPVLERLAASCTREERARLRLPVTIHFSGESEDSAYIIDPLAAEVLHRLEGWGAAYPFRDGRMGLPQSLAVELLSKYRGALQRLMR